MSEQYEQSNITSDFVILITWPSSNESCKCSFQQFLEDNEFVFSDEWVQETSISLCARHVVTIGGGATPLFYIRYWAPIED